MLKLLIVEDEKLEREGLLNFLDWGSFGLEIADTACDGIEGVEKAQRICPDIIITDIKMPGLDGLGMSRRIKQFLPHVRIIILTGYDDFRMAREAISLNVNAYVLKPLEEDELIPVLKKVIDECMKEREREEGEKSLKAQLLKNLGLARNKFLSDLLEGTREGDVPGERFAEYGIRLPAAGSYMAAVVKLWEDPDGLGEQSGESRAAWRPEYTGIAGSVLGDSAVFSLEGGNNDQCVFCLHVPEGNVIALKEKLHELCDALSCKSGGHAVVGTGSISASVCDMGRSCAQALQAAEFGVFWSDSDVIGYDRVDSLRSEFADKTGEFLIRSSYFSKQLVHAVRSCDEVRLFSLLAEMFSYIRSCQGAGRELTATCLQNLVNETSIILYTTNRSLDSAGTARQDPGARLAGLWTLQAMEDCVSGFFRDTFEYINGRRNNRDGEVIKKVINIIEERYMNDINLKQIAREVYLSPNYLGTVFRKFTGRTFNDYLCEYRMERAKILLESPKNKVGAVAEKVGIPNTSYFCTIFKNRFGVAPGEYQEQFLRK